MTVPLVQQVRSESVFYSQVKYSVEPERRKKSHAVELEVVQCSLS
jgi:hypothetical protein